MVGVEDREVFCSPMIRSQSCSELVSLGCDFHFLASFFSVDETGRLKGTGTEYAPSPGGKTHRNVGAGLSSRCCLSSWHMAWSPTACQSFRWSYQAVQQLLFPRSWDSLFAPVSSVFAGGGLPC